MKFRNEEKLRIVNSKIFQLKEWVNKNDGFELYPNRLINSVYFDNNNYSMFNESVEGITPRKKIRLRTYDKEFNYNNKANKEIKITSVEGRYKISESVYDTSKLLKLGIYDNNYGLCVPVLNIVYERSYFRIKDIRLTIDKNIAYKKFSNGKISNFSTVDNYNIVELKYDVRQSVDYVIKNFPFERVRFSKYCRGIEFTRLNYCNEI
jgi:SPX domain protein involved in polyphosphate accumulation